MSEQSAVMPLSEEAQAVVDKYKALGYPVSVEEREGKTFVVIGANNHVLMDHQRDYIADLVKQGTRALAMNGGASPPKGNNYVAITQHDTLLKRPRNNEARHKLLAKKLASKRIKKNDVRRRDIVTKDQTTEAKGLETKDQRIN